MNYLSRLCTCLLLLLCALACQKPAFITAPDSMTFSVDGTGQTITITVNRDWRITSSESWCTPTPQSGTASDDPVTITVKCQSNASYDERKAMLTIQTDELSHKIQIVQTQRDAIFSDTDLLQADYQAQDLVIPAEANVDFSVTVLKGGNWIRPVQTKGLVPKEVRIHVDENRSGAVREGSVMLSKSPASFTFLVRQAPWNAVLDQTVPGLYGIKGNGFLYQPGASQLSRGKMNQASFFRILNPDPPAVLSVEGLPNEMTLTTEVPLNVRLVTGEDGVIYQTASPAVVLRESDSLVWLLLSGDTGLIVKK